MSDRFSSPFHEALLVQPYEGITLELVRRWHQTDGGPRAEHSYRARQGTRIVSEHLTLEKVHRDLKGRYRSQPIPAPARRGKQSKRLPLWLD